MPVVSKYRSLTVMNTVRLNSPGAGAGRPSIHTPRVTGAGRIGACIAIATLRTPGVGRQPLEDLLVKADACVGVAVLRARQTHVDGDEIARIEARDRAT